MNLYSGFICVKYCFVHWVFEEVNGKLHERFGDKRGISPILATLLLIVIAVAAIIVTYAWITTYTGGVTHQAGSMISFDEKHIDSTTDNVTIYVRNKSTTETVSIDKIYIEGKDFTPYTNLRDGAITISPGEVVVVTTITTPPSTFDFQPGSVYTVKISGPETYWQEDIVAD